VTADGAGAGAGAVRVGIAIVELRGRYLVGRRAEDADLPGQAEFPGGKCEPDESPREAAVRECREETGLEVAPVRLLQRCRHEYEHATVELHFWLCRAADPADEPSGGFRWLSPAELITEPFPPANGRILDLIRSDSPLLGPSSRES
jgi:8-oxo-dGTP diphosphatase